MLLRSLDRGIGYYGTVPSALSDRELLHCRPGRHDEGTGLGLRGGGGVEVGFQPTSLFTVLSAYPR